MAAGLSAKVQYWSQRILAKCLFYQPVNGHAIPDSVLNCVGRQAGEGTGKE
jgi:hypothetical protein